MKKILFIFTFFLFAIGFAQNDEAYVDGMASQKMAELEMQGHSEYFLRKHYCEGNIQMFVMPDGTHCASKSTYYSIEVFWRENEEVMRFQKFDNCGSFSPLPFGISKNMKKILKDKAALAEEEVKPFKNDTEHPNPYGNMSVKDCHVNYSFVFSGQAFEKNFREIDLTDSPKSKNLNADHNNALLLIKLEKEISNVFTHFETNGRFFREN